MAQGQDLCYSILSEEMKFQSSIASPHFIIILFIRPRIFDVIKLFWMCANMHTIYYMHIICMPKHHLIGEILAYNSYHGCSRETCVCMIMMFWSQHKGMVEVDWWVICTRCTFGYHQMCASHGRKDYIIIIVLPVPINLAFQGIFTWAQVGWKPIYIHASSYIIFKRQIETKISLYCIGFNYVQESGPNCAHKLIN